MNPISILIVKSSAIGDIIQSFPALDYLRKKFPNARIDWVVEQEISSLLRAHPHIDHVIDVSTKSWRRALLSKKTRLEFKSFLKQLRAIEYDLLFDLQGNTKSALLTVCARAKQKVGFDWRGVREILNLIATTKRFKVATGMNIRLKYLHLVQAAFGDDRRLVDSEGVHLKLSEAEMQRCEQICSMPKSRLMVCFGSKWPNKRMELATLQAFLQKIALESHLSFLFIFATEEERRCAEDLACHFEDRAEVIGHLSLPLWQALMWKMEGVIAVDSAALHLCGTTQTPSLSYFGPSMAAFYKPIEKRHIALQGRCPYGKIFSSRCPILRTCSSGACMRQFSIEELFAEFKIWRDLSSCSEEKNQCVSRQSQ